MYCTLADLLARFHPDDLLALADDDQDGVADSSVLEDALSEAAAEMDLFLGVRYALPLPDPPPAVLRPLAVALAAHRLYLRRRQALSPIHAADYARAVETLAAVSRGELALVGVPSRRRAAATRAADEKRISSDVLDQF
ncbi:MAG: hypothetical protein Kow0059_15770 [Candidatus Sumerlaeia bacterium]